MFSPVAAGVPARRRPTRRSAATEFVLRSQLDRSRPGWGTRWAMTLPEVLIAGTVLAIVLLLTALAVSSIRNELKRSQATELLATLDRSLAAWHGQTGTWPKLPSPATAAAVRAKPADGPPVPRESPGVASGDGNGDADVSDGSADGIVAILAAMPASRQILDQITSPLRIQRDARGNEVPGWGTVQDPWGHRLRCLTASSPSAVERQAVAANGGRPIFISAGPNGRFHTATGTEAADDLRSDELPR